MKKLLVFGLSLVMLSTAVFADTSISGTSLPLEAAVNVQYEINDTTGRYSIGFADNATNAGNGTGISKSTINLSIDSKDNTIVSNVPEKGTDTGLYVFWNITSAAKYKLSLATTALEGQREQDPKTIGITVTGSVVGENIAETPVSIDADSTTEKSFDIFSQTTAGTIATKKGMQMLTIKSNTGELEGKPADTYSANLTLKLTTV